MIVASNGNELRIEAENDVDYVLKSLPATIAHEQASRPASTKLVIALSVDGTFTKPIPGGRGLITRADNDAVQKKLGMEPSEFHVNSARIDQIFSVRAKLRFEYELGDCKGEELVDIIKKRLKTFRDKGLRIQELPPSDE
jgi:hypothetical protein